MIVNSPKFWLREQWGISEGQPSQAEIKKMDREQRTPQEQTDKKQNTKLTN